MATFVTAFTLLMKRPLENIMGSAIGLINTGGTLWRLCFADRDWLSGGKTHSYASAFLFLSLAMVCSVSGAAADETQNCRRPAVAD